MKKISFFILIFILIFSISVFAQLTEKTITDSIRELINQNKPRQALQIVNNYLKTHPNSPQGLNAKATIYVFLGNIDSAFIYYNKTLQIDSTELNALSNLANIFFYNELYDTAIVILKKAYKFHPDSNILAYKIGAIYLINGQPEEANKYFIQALSTTDKIQRAKVYFYISEIYYQYFDSLNTALKYLDSSMSLHIFADQYQLKASIYYLLNKYNKALEAINNAVKIKPHNFSYIKTKIAILTQLNRYEEAINICKGLSNVVNTPELFTLWSDLYTDVEDYDSAMFAINQGILRFPNSAQLYYKKAILYSNIDDTNNVLININKAIELDSTNTEYIDQKIKLEIKINTPKDKIDDQNNFFTLFNVKHYKKLKKIVKSKEYNYKTLVREFLNNPYNFGLDKFFMLYIGATYQKKYDPEKAQFIEKILSIIYSQGKYEACIKQANEFEKSFPYCMNIYYYKALCFLALNNYTQYTKELYKYYGFLYGIYYSGTGLTPDSAFIINNELDEVYVLNYAGYTQIIKETQKINGYLYDIVVIQQNNDRGLSGITEKIYFFKEFFNK